MTHHKLSPHDNKRPQKNLNPYQAREFYQNNENQIYTSNPLVIDLSLSQKGAETQMCLNQASEGVQTIINENLQI